MRRILHFMAIGFMLFIASCTHDDSLEEKYIYSMDFTYSIFRVSGSHVQRQYPQIFLRHLEFSRHLDEVWVSRRDSTSDFTHILSLVEELYRTEDFFDANYLVLFTMGEPSGSIHHGVDSVYSDGIINMTRFLPDIQTNDSVQWLVAIELPNERILSQLELNITDEHVFFEELLSNNFFRGNANE